MPTIFNSKANLSSVQLCLRTLRNETLNIHVEATATVYELKSFVYRKYHIPVETQQLFHQGRLLKDKRCLSTYKLNAQSTMVQPILLTQALDVQVIISQKVLSLHSLSLRNRKANKLSTQQRIQCGETTTTNAILKQLHLSHLSHLLKVCVGSGTVEIQDMEQKVLHIPTLLEDGMISILFSTRWFGSRTAAIDSLNSTMSRTVRKCIDGIKALKLCASFTRLNQECEKTEASIMSMFCALDGVFGEEDHEISKALKWCNKLKTNSDEMALLNQIEKKVENIDNTYKKVHKKWTKKQAQIVSYLEETVRGMEDELMSQYGTWTCKEVIEWLQYMDHRIVLSRRARKGFQTANIVGYNLSDINQLSLKLMGVDALPTRTLIIGYVHTLLKRYDSDASVDASFQFDKNVCCVCVTNQVNTVIAPCGHAVYCSNCSKKSAKHCNRCPICRKEVDSIINVYKAGF
eukprot:79845_1